MQKVKIEPFKVIGITVITSNVNGQSAQDIGGLWNKFMSEGILQKIPNKLDETVFSIYTDYEGDHTKPYRTLLGCKVSSLESIPEGMHGQSFEGGTYHKYVSKGNLMEGVVYNTWTEIWSKETNRSFVADFEMYGEKAQNREAAEVDVLVGINE